MLNKALDMSENLINELKDQERVFLNAEKWDVVFEAFQRKGPLAADAKDIIWNFAHSLIRKQVGRRGFNHELEDEYRTRAFERLQKYIFENEDRVNVSYFRLHVVTGPYNDAIKQKQKQNRNFGTQIQPNGVFDPLGIIPDPKKSSIDKIICFEQEKLILEEIDKIPPAQKQAIYGRLMKERTYKEMAAERGVEEGAIRQAIHTGRKLLKKRLLEIDETKQEDVL